MKYSKLISMCTLVLLILASSLFENSKLNLNGKVHTILSRNDISINEEQLPFTYVQAGIDQNNIECLRFTTPIPSTYIGSSLIYTRKAEGYDDRKYIVKSFCKYLICEENKPYYFDGNSLVNRDSNSDYYWANYISIKYAPNSTMKSKMISVYLESNGVKFPFLTTSYEAVIANNSPVASFFDINGKLLGRSIVKSGEVSPLFEGEVPEVENAIFEGWDDGVNVYKILPKITKDTVFNAKYKYVNNI